MLNRILDLFWLLLDHLFLNAQNLCNQQTVTQKDLHSVFNWIFTQKPLKKGEFDWIYDATDIIPLSRIGVVEHSILTSFMKVSFSLSHDESPNRKTESLPYKRQSER